MENNRSKKIIVALDVQSVDDAKRLLDELSSSIGIFKVGLELISAVGTRIIDIILSYGCEVFYDCKFHDIPNTVAGASKAVTRLGVKMFNIHAMGGKQMITAAVDSSKKEADNLKTNPPLVLAVSVLTSIDDLILNNELRINQSVKNQVIHLARIAVEAGVDGIIASPNEVMEIKENIPGSTVVITPGIRPLWSEKMDQKRIMTPLEAIKNGADYLVIGRPITSPPDSIGSPKDAAKRVLDEISLYE